ncbi:crotonase/enoyl-CoA hydratase family protein [Pseudomonas sp. F1_0610]|uniref:crotonase/enoyl-CoA hydratase family protein n=1 Tax=Pseudomonas sp. F1_0610 TaxID=3114284 RepID=UPI0039C30358
MTQYKAFKIEHCDKIAQIKINRPEKANAMDAAFWDELLQIMQWIDNEPSVRVAVISGEGKHFSAGIDLTMFMQLANAFGKDPARNANIIKQKIFQLQSTFNAIDQCSKPVIAAIHGACVGGAVDLIAACDMRYCAKDARFSIKEIDIGMAADVGTLQRLPHIISDGVMRELAYTGREVSADEALHIGLVNQVYASKEELCTEVLHLAQTIASKSPVAVRGTKEMLRYARDHSVSDGLNYIANWNAAMLQSNDLKIAIMASMQKQKPEFED